MISNEEALAIVRMLRNLHLRLNMLQAFTNRAVSAPVHHWNEVNEDIEECKAILERLWP